MHAQTLAQMAYASPDAPARTPRAIEYEIFARITQRLRAAAQRRRTDFPALAAALGENARLWTVIAADVADDGNALPAPLRARLFYLSEFTRHQTRRVLAGQADADVLVDVNVAVMRGLRGDGGGT